MARHLYRLWTAVMMMLRAGRRPLSLGVRIIVPDGEDRVLLVRHTYVRGWHLPGGGVKRRETLVAGAVRELREEAGVIAAGAPELLGAYTNFRHGKSDHVLVYVVRQWRREAWEPGLEIADCAFFPLDGLPDDTSPGTRRRLAEFRRRAVPSATW